MTSRGPNDKSSSESLTIPVIEERAALLSKPKDKAAVRIQKDVRERVASIETVLRADEVLVERYVLDPPRRCPAGRAPRGDAVVIPILEERLVVKKQLFVREELRVRRVDRSRVNERVTLRSEDVRIDRQPRSPNATDSTEPSSKPPEESEMERVLIGVFDSKNQAEMARRQLRDCGIAEDRITVRAATRNDLASATSTTTGEEDDSGFFARLFRRVEGHESHPTV